MRRFGFAYCLVCALAVCPLSHAQVNSAGNGETEKNAPTSPSAPSEPAAPIAPPTSGQSPLQQAPHENAAGGQKPPAGSASERSKTAAELKTAARKDKEEEHKPADPDTGSSTLSDETLGIIKNPWVNRGVKFSASYIGEALGNPSGGLRQGAIYEGRLNLAIDLDFAKIASVNGFTFHANIFQSHGEGLSRNYIGNLSQVSSLEALATTRLYEMWFEQEFTNKLTLRVGQLAADTEFMTSRYTDALINSTFGWPTIFGVNMPSGGPSPPLAAVGARMKVELNDRLTVLAAIFNGDPAGPGQDDPQSRNRYGLNFRINDSELLLGEIQYAYNHEKNSRGLPGTLKIGAWRNGGNFNDQRFAANGVSQASPSASTQPAQLKSDFGVYSVFEQLLLTLPGGDNKRGVAFFARGSVSPKDRNLIEAYADVGLSFLGPLESRPADKLTVAFAYSKISSAAQALDNDYRILTGNPRPIRDYEGLLTVGYLAEIRPGWTVLPNVQYIIHPGGGYVLDPGGVPRAVRDALVFGLRSVAKF
jgi:porin